MAFCQNCGKEIAEGQVCSCQQTQTQEQAPAAAQAQGSKMPIIIGAAAAVAVIAIVLVIVLVSSLGGGYKTPVKDLATAINKADGKMLISTMIDKDHLDEMIEESGVDDEDELYEELDEQLEEILEMLEDEYGKGAKISISIEDADEIDEDDLEDTEDYYDDYLNMNVKIKKGYELECVMSVKGKDGEDENDLEIQVYQFEEGGWKIGMDTMNSLF